MSKRPPYMSIAMLVLAILMVITLPPRVAQRDAVLNTYRTLVEVDAIAKLQFVKPISDDRLVDGAIHGMMQKLDPYSGYFAPDEYENFRRRMDGDYIGVGVDIGMQNSLPVVISSIEGCSAAKADVRAGDVILRVNDQDTEGLSVFDVEKLLAGDADTLVNLTLHRPGQEVNITKTVERRRIALPTVRGFERQVGGAWNYLIDPAHKIGYIRISRFRSKTGEEFATALRQMDANTLAGLVLDLRFNGGGILEQAVSVVDQFITHGSIVSTITRRKVVKAYDATDDSVPKSLRLAVLINGGSASASEIVAGALQDHKRAVLVGERSFGKGSVQQIVKLRSCEGAIKITVAHYRLPSGRIIHRDKANEHTDKWGIIPDEVVTLTAAENAALQQAWQSYRKSIFAYQVPAKTSQYLASKQATLKPHQIIPPDKTSPAKRNTMAYTIAKDRQLSRAIELLQR